MIIVDDTVAELSQTLDFLLEAVRTDNHLVLQNLQSDTF